MAKIRSELTVNGERHTVVAEPDEPLLWVLRDRLNLTGTKYGCGEGACGACTVLVDGRAERSCLLLLEDLDESHDIVTIEGLARDG